MSRAECEIVWRAPCLEGVGRKELKVNFSKEFNRKSPPQELNVERVIEETWSQRLAKASHKSLWDQSKFRLDSILNENGLSINLGLTTYRDFIGTNCGPISDQLYQPTASNPHAFLSDALGVGSIVLTSDGAVILLKRGQSVGEAQGLYDIPGGHAESDRVFGRPILNSIYDGSFFESADSNKADSSAIVKELYDSVIDEVISETGVPGRTLSEPILIQIFRNTSTTFRPSLQFFMRVALTSDEVRGRYRLGLHSEVEESTEILCISLKELVEKAGNNGGRGLNLAPTTLGIFGIESRWILNLIS